MSECLEVAREGARIATVVWVAVVACGPQASPGPAAPTSPGTPPVTAGSATAAGSAGSAADDDAAPPALATGPAILPWPVAPFTADQAAAEKACDAEKLADQRYPKSMALDALPPALPTASPCDHAALAIACGSRVPDGSAAPASCVAAYRDAVTANPALAVAPGMPDNYFDRVVLVAPPPVAKHALASAELVYHWTGLGTEVSWTLAIRDANTAHASATATGAKAASQPAAAAVGSAAAALGSALDGLLPIAHPIEAVNCFDNYPDWTAKLTYDDGEVVQLTTNKSNLLGLGGPWRPRSTASCTCSSRPAWRARSARW